MSDERPRLPRILGAPSAAGVLVGLMIGSGIFRVPSSIAMLVETPGAAGLVWLAGGVLALCGALAVLELTCLYPEAGGVYVFLREAYGKLPAFLYGWTRLLLLVPASLGAISLILASYLRTLVPLGAVPDRVVAVVVIATLALLNYRSLLWGAALENVVSAAKVIALAVLVVLAFAFGDGSSGALAGPLEFAPASWSGFGLAMVTVMWAYSGWSSSAALAGEVRDPARNMPIAVVGGVGVVVALYVATNAAYLYLLPIDAMAGSSLVAADAARRVVGDAGGAVIAVLVVVSTFGAVQAALMFNPRIFYAMASDGLLFAPIGRVHSTYLTPHLATLFTAGLGIVYVSLRSFEQLAQAFILGAWPFEILVVWSVFRLRRLRPDAPRPFRVPGYPVVPAVFLCATVAMIVNALVQRPGLTLFGFGLILAGLPFYFVATRRLGH